MFEAAWMQHKGVGVLRVYGVRSDPTCNWGSNPKPQTLNPKRLDLSAADERKSKEGGSRGLLRSRGHTGWGPLVISRVIRALNWVIRTLS